jgi:hypothetical protein
MEDFQYMGSVLYVTRLSIYRKSAYVWEHFPYMGHSNTFTHLHRHTPAHTNTHTHTHTCSSTPVHTHTSTIARVCAPMLSDSGRTECAPAAALRLDLRQPAANTRSAHQLTCQSLMCDRVTLNKPQVPRRRHLCNTCQHK